MIENNYSILFNRETIDHNSPVSLNTEIPEELKWVSFMNILSGKDITKHDYIYEQNYIYCMQVLLLWHYEDMKYKQMQLAQQNNR